ncbi:MAG: PfkB family carbohydrate kinase [Alsobacter sp.]
MVAGVLCVGIATQDFVFALDEMPRRAEKYRARDLAVVGGGIAANAAVAVARLGGHAALATRLGEDAVGRDILDDLVAAGVDCRLARRFHGHTSSLSAVLVDAHGERTVINHADLALPDDPSWLPAALGAEVGAVMADTRWERGSLHLLGLARGEGRAGVLDADRGLADRALLDAATHVAFAAQAVREMTGRDEPREGLRELARTASGWLAVTDGAHGVWFTQGDGLSHLPAFPIRPVDTLGAGDVFHGALALALAEGRPIEAALRFAMAAAAIKCTRFGGRAGAPTRAEVEALLAGAGHSLEAR